MFFFSFLPHSSLDVFCEQFKVSWQLSSIASCSVDEVVLSRGLWGIKQDLEIGLQPVTHFFKINKSKWQDDRLSQGGITVSHSLSVDKYFNCLLA